MSLTQLKRSIKIITRIEKSFKDKTKTSQNLTNKQAREKYKIIFFLNKILINQIKIDIVEESNKIFKNKIQ